MDGGPTFFVQPKGIEGGTARSLARIAGFLATMDARACATASRAAPAPSANVSADFKASLATFRRLVSSLPALPEIITNRMGAARRILQLLKTARPSRPSRKVKLSMPKATVSGVRIPMTTVA